MVDVIELPSEIVERARRIAAARGVELSLYVQELVERDVQQQESVSAEEQRPAAERTPAERAATWRKWVDTHAVKVDHEVDVSRESIYD